MRIVFNELKRIFNFKMVLLLIIINLIMYFLFIRLDVTYFAKEGHAKDMHEMYVEIRNKYGNNMDKSEFKDFKKSYYNEKIKEINKHIENNSELNKYGIKNYDELIKKYNTAADKTDRDSQKIVNIYEDIMFKREVEAFYQLESIEWFINWYNNKDSMMSAMIANNPNIKSRVEEIVKRGDETSIFSSIFMDNYNNLIRGTCSTIIIGSVFMILPIYFKDKKNNIRDIQYTCKNGRKIFKDKIMASIIASLIITTVDIIILFILYRNNNTSMFFDCSVNSVFNQILSWYNITFIQYIIITVVAVYILALAFCLTSILISSLVKNYISLIALELPIVLIVIVLLLEKLIGAIDKVIYAKWIFPVIYLCIFLVPIILMIVRWRKEKSLDIV
ncbi:hypothetical protein [Clostridium massiliodielmoense]|uniref:hypothetical protein n=1 Tax=Clostridium massiliodielmoense TaxID=1776385 RepID=UPI000A2675B0|nr:hypothetical protein [Clostridium massiliodielmoense]